MELNEILSNDQVQDSEILHLHTGNPRSEVTHHYVATENGVDVGFLSVDLGNEALVLYTLYVPPRLRKKGYATRILKAAEMLAQRLGYQQTRLHPQTLAPGELAQSDLTDWYLRQGYRPLPNVRDMLMKEIS